MLTFAEYECEKGCFRLFIVSNTAFDFNDLVILNIVDVAVILYWFEQYLLI